jgi:hypothetical protein
MGRPCVCPHIIGGVLCHVKHTLNWLFCSGPCHSTCLADGCGCGGHGAYGGGGYGAADDDCCHGGEYGGEQEMGGYDAVPPATVVPTPTEANPFKDDPASGAPQALKRRTIRPTSAVLQAVPRAPRDVKPSVRPQRAPSGRSTMVRKTSATLRNTGTTKSIRSHAHRDGHSVRRRASEPAQVRSVEIP